MAKKRKGVFRAALRGRLAVIQALRDLGLSWQEVAFHFRDDEMLGGASGRHFCSEWSRLGSAGLRPSNNETAACREMLLKRGGSDWMIIRSRP